MTAPNPALDAGECLWCGEFDCPDRPGHRFLNGRRETTWREPYEPVVWRPVNDLSPVRVKGVGVAGTAPTPQPADAGVA